jgi:membrane-bound ClpP family serine protease
MGVSQMDPVSALVAAIVAGATAAATDVATSTIKDAYQGLKSLIATKFRRKAAVEMIEEAPDSLAAKDALGAALQEVKADKDPEVLKLAESLTAALKALGPDQLQRAKIKIGDVDGARNAIVKNLSALGDITVGNMTARSGDAVVSNLTAGVPPKKP